MHCIQALIPTCASKQGHEMKMKTQQKVSKMVAQDMSIYGMMFRKRAHVSTKFTQMTYVKSSDLIKPSEEFFQKTPPTSPNSTSRRLAVEKMEVIETTPTSAKPWSAAVHAAVTRAVDTEAAAVAVAAKDVHSIGHVAPDGCVGIARCGRRSARGQLTPAIGLAKVAQMFWRDQ